MIRRSFIALAAGAFLLGAPAFAQDAATTTPAPAPLSAVVDMDPSHDPM
jgi:hypothetical protein